jgi:hypothetical protein
MWKHELALNGLVKTKRFYNKWGRDAEALEQSLLNGA